MDIFLIGGGQKVERKWGFILCGLVMYNILIGCGENVGFLPTNCPHFLCPAKVKQYRVFIANINLTYAKPFTTNRWLYSFILQNFKMEKSPKLLKG